MQAGIRRNIRQERGKVASPFAARPAAAEKRSLRLRKSWQRRALLFAFVLLAASALPAQGGPPFITDDPGTPGAGNWEINFGWTGNHTADGGQYELPDADVNYGWGDRIQLKLELPLAARTDASNTTVAGLGNLLVGIKWRPYEHHRAGEPKSSENMNFSWGFYPQAYVDNPTSSVRRGVVDRGPQYYLPTELTWQLGPLSFNGEVGRWIGNHSVPDQWARGLIVGREFTPRFELYGELYNLQDIDSLPGEARQRSLTLDAGLRRDLNRTGKIRLLAMGGRSMHRAAAGNSEPNWIAYVGVQFLIGHDSGTGSAGKE